MSHQSLFSDAWDGDNEETRTRHRAFWRPDDARMGATLYELAPDALADLDERALLLDGQRREAEVAEHVEQVDDGVFLEHDRVVAGRNRDGAIAGASLRGCLASDGRSVDGARWSALPSPRRVRRPPISGPTR